MRSNVKNKIAVFIFSVFLLATPVLADDLKIIYSAPLEVNSFFELRALYMFETNAAYNGGDVTIVHFDPDSIEFNYFVEHMLLMSTMSYSKLLKAKQATGFASTIRIVANEETVLKIIESTPSSIGYVNNNLYIRGDNSDVRVIDFSNIGM